MNKCYMIIYNIYIIKRYRERIRKMILCFGFSIFFICISCIVLVDINKYIVLVDINK